MKKSTGLKDKNGKEIFVGDVLQWEDAYKITVIEEDGEFCGKLVCEDNHPCKDALYHINNEQSVIVE